MIVIAIIGILAAIALPAYQSYVEKTELAAAKSRMTTIYQGLARAKLAEPTKYSPTTNGASGEYVKFIQNNVRNTEEEKNIISHKILY